MIDDAAEVIRHRNAKWMEHDVASRQQRREGVPNEAVSKCVGSDTNERAAQLCQSPKYLH